MQEQTKRQNQNSEDHESFVAGQRAQTYMKEAKDSS